MKKIVLPVTVSVLLLVSCAKNKEGTASVLPAQDVSPQEPVETVGNEPASAEEGFVIEDITDDDAVAELLSWVPVEAWEASLDKSYSEIYGISRAERAPRLWSSFRVRDKRAAFSAVREASSYNAEWCVHESDFSALDLQPVIGGNAAEHFKSLSFVSWEPDATGCDILSSDGQYRLIEYVGSEIRFHGYILELLSLSADEPSRFVEMEGYTAYAPAELYEHGSEVFRVFEQNGSFFAYYSFGDSASIAWCSVPIPGMEQGCVAVGTSFTGWGTIGNFDTGSHLFYGDCIVPVTARSDKKYVSPDGKSEGYWYRVRLESSSFWVYGDDIVLPAGACAELPQEIPDVVEFARISQWYRVTKDFPVPVEYYDNGVYLDEDRLAQHLYLKVGDCIYADKISAQGDTCHISFPVLAEDEGFFGEMDFLEPVEADSVVLHTAPHISEAGSGHSSGMTMYFAYCIVAFSDGTDRPAVSIYKEPAAGSSGLCTSDDVSELGFSSGADIPCSNLFGYTDRYITDNGGTDRWLALVLNMKDGSSAIGYAKASECFLVESVYSRKFVPANFELADSIPYSLK